MKKTPLPIFLLLSIWSGPISMAQVETVDTLMARQLEEVVITGQFEPQSARKSVYHVRTLPLEVLQARGATRLQDVLNTELNLRFSQDQTLGGSNLSMQGLAGQNVKVLIDGVPMVGRQGTSNEININQINIQSIERIEIVEGPMSVVYGADALAGVINIITKKNNEGKWEVSARVQEESAGTEYGLSRGVHNQSIGGGYTWDRFFTRMDLTRNTFGGWQGSATGRDRQWHPKTQWLPSGVVGYRTDQSEVYYRLDYLHEDIYNPGAFDGTEALDQNYITNRFMHQVQGSHRFSDHLSYNGAISYTDYSRKTQSSTVNQLTGERRLALGAGLQDQTDFQGVTTRGTFHYRLTNKLSIQPGYDVNLERAQGGRIKVGRQHIEDYAFFLSAEWEPLKGLQLRPGLRIIHNSVYNAPPVVPSFNSKFALNERQDLRFSYGRGFRSPSIRELYFDFFDASHSIEGNPALSAELSHSFNASWNWRIRQSGQLQISSSVGGFYNTVENMIGYGQKPGNVLITTYLNIDKFKTQGLTWNNRVKYKRLDASLGFSYTGRFNQYAESDASLASFAWSPELISSVSYKLPQQGWIFSVYYKYTGVTPNFEVIEENGSQTVNLTEIAGFHWGDVTIQKFISDFTLTAGVRNIFNVVNINSTSTATGAHSGSGTRPIGYGTSGFVGVAYMLSNH
ncbi:MAG: TonB-dependent receptor plug domain-containing protein [Cyclobacteriaceae bacterium]